MNNMAAIAEIIATCTSIKVLQHNDIVVNRRHDLVNRTLANRGNDIANRRHNLVNRMLTNRALNIVNCAHDIVNCELNIVNCGSLTPVPFSMCFGTNGTP